MAKYDIQCALNIRCAENPKKGDYWHEMFMPVCTVTRITKKSVYVTKHKDKKTVMMDKDDFRKWLAYDSMPNKFWPDVVPSELGNELA